MKRILLFIGAFVLFFIAFIGYTLSSTGFFRTVNPSAVKPFKSFPVKGTEDLALSREDGFVLISSFGDRENEDGQKAGMYFLDLKDATAVPKYLEHSKPGGFYPHGISMIKLDTITYKVLVINHVDTVVEGENKRVHSIEVFHLRSDTLIYKETIKDPLLISPNDIVAVDENRFFFTNDHGTDTKWGRIKEDYLGLALANVGYFDGETFSIVAEGMSYANGINYDAARELMFVANTRSFDVAIYQWTASSTDFNFVETIDCKTGVDNIEFGEDGKLWIGCHPSLMHFTFYISGKQEKAPSEIITIDYQEKGNYAINSLFVDDGSLVSGTSVAIPYQDKIVVGTVIDDNLLILNP